ncbi:hypothetical protein ACJA23_00535 [Mycoplasma corogypsi]|uniref:hypothetical protein n=1 Tax=Mycoplasma corogypsi TaxID=2106 RepID=UPI003873BEDF
MFIFTKVFNLSKNQSLSLKVYATKDLKHKIDNTYYIFHDNNNFIYAILVFVDIGNSQLELKKFFEITDIHKIKLIFNENNLKAWNLKWLPIDGIKNIEPPIYFLAQLNNLAHLKEVVKKYINAFQYNYLIRFRTLRNTFVSFNANEVRSHWYARDIKFPIKKLTNCTFANVYRLHLHLQKFYKSNDKLLMSDLYTNLGTIPRRVLREFYLFYENLGLIKDRRIVFLNFKTQSMAYKELFKMIYDEFEFFIKMLSPFVLIKLDPKLNTIQFIVNLPTINDTIRNIIESKDFQWYMKVFDRDLGLIKVMYRTKKIYLNFNPFNYSIEVLEKIINGHVSAKRLKAKTK